MLSAVQPPPEVLLSALTAGPSSIRGVEWHDAIGSTNDRAAELAAAGAPEVQVVLADEQTTGRGRLGRVWQAPPGSSLMASFLLRPAPGAGPLTALPLVAGLALAETVERHLRVAGSAAEVGLKWPNDLLLDGRKAAGVLVERHGGAVVVGLGCNVDWRGVPRPAELGAATSIAEAAGGPIDRWRLLAGLVGVLTSRYAAWGSDSGPALDAYRERCATVGREVRVELATGRALHGRAVAVDDDGALLIEDGEGLRTACTAGDVHHVRGAEVDRDPHAPDPRPHRPEARG